VNTAASSQEERQLVEVHIRRNVSDFATIDCDFVCQHARGWDLDRISPVVVVVAESVREVENRVFWNLGGIGSYVEMSRFDCSLGHRVRNQEEIKGSVDDLRLLNETVINVGTLWRVSNGSVHALLEESLSHTLVDNNQGMLWQWRWIICFVLLLDDLTELFKLVTDYLSSHGIADTVSVDENVIWKGTVVVISKRLESGFKVVLKHARADDFLALLALGTCLRIVFAHVLIVCCAETNDTLFTLMANIDSDEHRLWRDFRTEVKTPKISTKLCIDLSQDIDVDPVVVLLDRLAWYELRDNWTVGVDLVLQSCVKMLLLDRVRHDDQEEVKVLALAWLAALSALCVFTANVSAVVVINSVLEGFDTWLVAELYDVTVVNVDIESSLLWKLVESIVQVFSMRDIFLKTEDCPLSEMDRLMNTSSEDLGVVELSCSDRSTLVGWTLVLALILHQNWRSFQDSGLDSIRLKINIKIPFLNFFRVSNHTIQLFDTSDSFWRLLEEALSNISHHSLILSDLGRDSDECA
jgi:hypothetical protein